MKGNRVSCYEREEGGPTLGWVGVKAGLPGEQSEKDE